MRKKHETAKRAALVRFDKLIQKCGAKLDAALTSYPPPAHLTHALQSLTSSDYNSGYLPLSNVHSRRAAAEAMIDVSLRHHRRTRDDDLRHYLFSMTTNNGFTFERAPAVDLAAVKLSARRALDAVGLQGFCCVDLMVLSKRLRGEPDRRVVFHVHGIAFTDDASFKPVSAAQVLSGNPRFGNILGAPAVTLKSRRQAAVDAEHRYLAATRRADQGNPPAFADPRFYDLDVDQTPMSMASLAGYLVEPIIGTKSRLQRADGRWITKTDELTMPLKTALRIAEIQSRYTPSQAVFGLGDEGTRMASELRVRMTAWQRSLTIASERLASSELDGIWTEYFDDYPLLGFKPSVVHLRG